MDTKLKDQMKQALLDLKESILRHYASESEEFKQLLEDIYPKDLADIAGEDIDRRILEALGSQDINRLQAIDAALSRIENDHYGLCVRCGKKIPKERLEAIPYAILCVDCKSSEERRSR